MPQEAERNREPFGLNFYSHLFPSRLSAFQCPPAGDAAGMSDLAPISEVASSLGIAPAHVLGYGTDKAKIHTRAIAEGRHHGKLILVSAITPTPAERSATLAVSALPT